MSGCLHQLALLSGLSVGHAVGVGAVGAAVAVSAAVYGAASPRSQLFMPVTWKGGKSSGSIADDPHQAGTTAAIALTFDDGPHPQATPRVLAHLREAGARATFFVIGRYVERYPALVEQIHQEGHLLANHTFDHHYTGLLRSTGYWVDQLNRTDSAVAQVIGQRPALFRPPMGFRHHRVRWAVRRTGHHVVTWTRRGYDGRPTTASAIVTRLAKPTRPNDILLLHDGVAPSATHSPAPTCDALPRLLASLQARQFTFARLDELIDLPGYRR